MQTLAKSAGAQPIPIPAPYLGINTREGLAALQATEARYLENWVPSGNALTPRKGYMNASTGGAAAPVKTLAAYNGYAASALIGVNGGSIYDFSSSVAVLLSAAGYSDSRFQTECTGNTLIGVNGTDTPWAYNGSAVVATGLSGSGLVLTKLANVKMVRTRLWFCEKDKADVWYGDVGAVTGTLTKFQLSQIAAGGSCMAIGSHSVTLDSGGGPQDLTVFVMDTGETIAYSGDPSTTFSIVGRYRVPPPIGRQCLVRVGGVLAVITRMGVVPISAAVNGDAFDPLATGPFGKISPSFQADASTYGSLEGWSGTFWNGLVIINVPTLDRLASKQYVFNSLVGAWTIWTGFNAGCWATYGTGLYWGAWATGTANSYGGANDNGMPVALKARQAFVTPAKGRLTEVNSIRFDISITGNFTGKFGIDIDYVQRTITTPDVAIASSSVSTPWGSPWGSAWSSSMQSKGQWFSTYGLGRAIGIALEATATSTDLSWFGSSVLAKAGGII